MDWQSLAMNSTELNWAGLGSGDAPASSERMDERMWWMQARQPSRKASSTAGESVKRLKDDAEERSEGPEEVAEVEVDSVEQKNNTVNMSFNSQQNNFFKMTLQLSKAEYQYVWQFSWGEEAPDGNDLGLSGHHPDH